MDENPRVLIFWNKRGELDEKDFALLQEAVSYVQLENDGKEEPEPASFRQGGKVIAAWTPENGLKTLDEVLERLKKLMQVKGYNGDGSVSEVEVDLATSRLQKLLADFNVDAATIEAMHDPRIPVQERRVQREVDRPVSYEWQDRLWSTLAHCNFCLHWVNKKYKTVKQPNPKYVDYYRDDDGTVSEDCPVIHVDKVVSKRHELIGRESNVASIEILGNYIENALLRMSPYPVTHKLANSWKMGASERIRERLLARKRKMEKEIKPAGPSFSTALALKDVFKSEYDANIDILYGEGTSARWAAEEREAEEKQAAIEERKEMMEDHPECFSREEYNEMVKEYARVKKRQEGQSTRRTKARDSYWDGVDFSAWYEGQKAGDRIGLDTQLQSTNATMIEG